MIQAPSDERRQHSRIAFRSSARLALSDRIVDVIVLDLSLKGALIELPAEASLTGNEVGVLHVQLNEDVISDQISMESRVAHFEANRVGLLCLAIDLDSVTHLRRLVELNLGDPRLLERELSALIAE